jgi:hypothetical protein
MPTYQEVLSQIQKLTIIKQIQLLKDLNHIVKVGIEVEGDDEIIPMEEIAESEATLQDYFTEKDRGISSQQLKLKLFG